MRKILGQLVGTGAIAQLYKVPSGGQTTVTTLSLQNTSATASATLRVSAAIADAADATKQTLLAITLDPGQRLSLTEAWTLGPADALRLTAPTNLSATLFGSEILA